MITLESTEPMGAYRLPKDVKYQRVRVQLSCSILQVLYGGSIEILKGGEDFIRYLCGFFICETYDVSHRYL